MPDADADSEPDSSKNYILYSPEYSKMLLPAVMWLPLFTVFPDYKFLLYTACMISVASLFKVTLLYNNSQLAQQNKEMTIHGMDS